MLPISKLAYIESKKNEIHYMVCKEGMKVPRLQEAFCRRFCMDNDFWASKTSSDFSKTLIKREKTEDIYSESQLRTALKRWEEEEPEKWAGQWNKRATMPEPRNAPLYASDRVFDSSRRSWST